MIRLKPEVRVYLLSSPIDGRKAIYGLFASVMESFDGKLRVGSVFVFYNLARNHQVFVLGHIWLCALPQAFRAWKISCKVQY